MEATTTVPTQKTIVRDLSKRPEPTDYSNPRQFKPGDTAYLTEWDIGGGRSEWREVRIDSIEGRSFYVSWSVRCMSTRVIDKVSFHRARRRMLTHDELERFLADVQEFELAQRWRWENVTRIIGLLQYHTFDISIWRQIAALIGYQTVEPEGFK